MNRSAPSDPPAGTSTADDGPPAQAHLERWARRALTLPLLSALALAYIVLLPVLVAIATALDLAGRRPWVFVRCLAMIGVYLWCEVVGVIAATATWLVSGVWAGAPHERFLRWNLALQVAWGTFLYRSAERIFEMRTVVEGLPAARGGPLLVLLRHVSTVDTLLPVVLLTGRAGRPLRYVLKRELLWDPCLDIVGNRLPNCFVRRGSSDSARETAAVARLAENLGDHEGVLIYPEGTRFTPAKRRRVLERLERDGDAEAHARARALRHVLPPRVGGTLALLAAAPHADVLIGAHTGFEGTRSLLELIAGTLVGATIRVQFRRVPRAQIPTAPHERIAWLHDEWRRVDTWVDTHQRGSGHEAADRLDQSGPSMKTS